MPYIYTFAYMSYMGITLSPEELSERRTKLKNINIAGV
jgi:hypothetical protein